MDEKVKRKYQPYEGQRRIEYLEMRRRYRFNLKRRAFKILGGIKCVRCGIEDIRVLTINHLNGGGRKERKSRKGLLLDIVRGTRKSDDLEVRCANCNYIYEYEQGKWKLPK